MRFQVLAALTIMLTMLSCAPEGEKGSRRIRLATTTSTYNSGLMEYLLPAFEAQAGVQVQVLAVGTGQALALGERGEVDLVLVHARSREDEFIASGYGVKRHEIMWNDFVIVGPPDDPAGISGESDVALALTRLAEHGAHFISRGDDSGTHIREMELWVAAGIDPRTIPGYLEAGQGMGNCLTIADEKMAYLLADRGTYLAFAEHIDLRVMVEGDARLRNPYGAIMVSPQRHPHVAERGATALIDYLVSSEGQQRIGAFRVGGEQLFHPVGGES